MLAEERISQAEKEITEVMKKHKVHGFFVVSNNKSSTSGYVFPEASFLSAKITKESSITTLSLPKYPRMIDFPRISETYCSAHAIHDASTACAGIFGQIVETMNDYVGMDKAHVDEAKNRGYEDAKEAANATHH